MSAPQSQLGINEQSSISELISVLRSSFQQEVYDEVESLITSRVNKLQTELNDLKKDFVSLRGEHDSMKSHYSSAVYDKAKVGQELMNCKCQLKDSRQQLDKKNGMYAELHQTAKKVHNRYKCVAEELKAVELDREYNQAKMNDELAKKDEELRKMKEENEASLAEMTDKLSKNDEELKVVKEENETLLTEMTEKLAKKDRELNQLWAERNVILEDLVARILFLEQDMKKYGVDAMHKKIDQFQEAVLENFSPAMESSARKGSCDGTDSAVVSKDAGLEAESLQNAVCQQVESEKMPNTLPTVPAEPSMNIPVIDLSSDGEEEGAVLTFRAKAVNGSGNKTPVWGEDGNDHRLKRDRSGSSTSESADSFCQEQKGKKRVGNNGCEVQDTAQSKEGKTWLDEFLCEKEKRKDEY